MQDKATTDQLTLEEAPRISDKAPTIPEMAEAVQAEIVEPSAMVATGTSAQGYGLEVATISSLERARELGEIFRIEAELLQVLNRAAIAATDPSDWVMMKDKQGAETGFLRAAGCRKVARYFGLVIYDQGPVVDGVFSPRKITGEGGAYAYEAHCSIYSRKLNNTIENVWYRKSIEEDFRGRSQKYGAGPLTEDGDLKRSCETGLHSRAIRMVTGYGRVAVETLKECGLDVDQAAKGSGYGSSSERSAKSVAPKEVKAKALELGKEILSRVGGDKSAARDLCKDVTSNPPKFGGFDTVERLTKGWQVENAWEKLRAHETFGDSAQGGAS